MPQQLHESVKLTEAATASDRKSGRMTIQVLTPGWGSSGYYSPEVCEAAAPLVAVGTQMYLDHPHADGSGVDMNGNRSVADIAAVITEAAIWDDNAQALVAECTVTKPFREFLADDNFAPHLGLSIRGSATDVTVGEAEGRTGSIIEGLAHISSVDFVSRAGRGGRVLQVLESLPPSAVLERAIGHGVDEATVNDTREALQAELRDAYGTPNDADRSVWVYVRDFDDTTVWFEVEGATDDPGTFGQAYTSTDGAVALAGERTEVRVRTTYVPVTRPDSTNPTTEADQEVTMGNISIEESVHTGLIEKAGRVDVLESENATQKARITELEEAEATRARVTRASTIIAERAKEGDVEFTALESRGLLADLPLKDGDLDEAAFTKAVDESAADKKTAAGTGRVRGFGSDTSIDESDDEDFDLDKRLAESLGDLMPTNARTVKEA
jgi:hypothetical protein